MKRFLLAGLLSVLSLWSFAQGDIPEKEDVVAPGSGFVRPLFRPGTGILFRKADGTYTSGRATRDPRLFLTWPAYLITNPVLGDQAMGPSLTADTTQRQFAIFNGNRWIEYGGKSAELTFGPAFSKTGNTVNLKQYPNSIGDIQADYLSLAYAPVKPSNPMQHTFMLYNPTSGKLDGMPYADVVSAMGVTQWPNGTLGNVGLESLNWSGQLPIVTAESMDLSNGYFLMQLGTTTVRMRFGDLKSYFSNLYGSGGGSGTSETFVSVPANELAPGKIGEYSYKEGYFYKYLNVSPSVQRWRRMLTDSTWNFSIINPGITPQLAARYSSESNQIITDWTYTGTDVASWDLFIDLGYGNGYEYLPASLAAGSRTYSFASPATGTYKLQIRGRRANNQLTPFSETATVTVSPPVSAYQPVTNVAITPLNSSNAFNFTFQTADAGGIASLQISRNVNASVTNDADWTTVSDLTINAAGTYTISVSGVNDTQARVFRIRRSGGSKTPSAWQKFGPASLSAVGETLNTPTLVASQVSGQNQIRLQYNVNNSGVESATLQRSEDNGASFPTTINLANPNQQLDYVDASVTAGKIYTYRMFITKGGKNSPFSANATVNLAAADVIPPPVMLDYYHGSYYEKPAVDVVRFTGTGGVMNTGHMGQYDYRINDGPWTFGSKDYNPLSEGTTNSPGWGGNFFETTRFQAGTTIRYRLRFWDYDNNRPEHYSLYSDVLKVVLGPSYRVNGNNTDFSFSKEPADQTPTGGSSNTDGPLRLSVGSQTNTQLTLNVANPSSTGIYHWSIYRPRNNDPNDPGDLIDNRFFIPGGSTLVLDLSKANLVPGTKYRAYASQANGEPAIEKQTRAAYVEFVRQATDNSNNINRVVAFGNSITTHGDYAAGGFDTKGDSWGMAATAKAKDYIHLWESMIKGINYNSTIKIRDANYFETTYGANYDYGAITATCQQEFADVVSIRLGDNIDDGAVVSRNLKFYLGEFIKACRVANPNMKFILSTSYWERPKYDEAVRAVIADFNQVNSPLIEANLNGKNTYENSGWASGNAFPDPAVGNHPGDKGHQEIANTMFEAYKVAIGYSAPVAGDEVVPGDASTTVPQTTVYLENSQVKVGFNFTAGGAVTYLSRPGELNYVNNADLGRQFQNAYYAFPVENFRPNGQEPHPRWAGIGYNPIQTGDVAGSPSQVTQWKQMDANTLYYRYVPKQWAYANVPCECYVDVFNKLNGKAVEVTTVLHNNRTDQYQLLPRGSEIIAGYLNSPFYRVKSYWGNQPWTGAALTDKDITEAPSGAPINGDGQYTTYLPENWTYVYAPSRPGQGVGLWSQAPHITYFNGGGRDEAGSGEHSSSFNYMGAVSEGELTDRKAVMKYKYAFLVTDNVNDVRAYAATRKSEAFDLNFDFSLDRQHWSTYHDYGTAATEYPFPGYWGIDFSNNQTPLISPSASWEASKYKKLEVVMATTGSDATASFSVHRRRNNPLQYNRDGYDKAFDDFSYSFPIVNDGQFRTYVIDLTANPEWYGVISRMYFNSHSSKGAGKTLKLKSIKGLLN